MKVTFCAIFVLALGLSNAFWSNCPGTNVPGPDDVISPNCGVDRCRVERGGEFPVVIFATPIGIHTELRTRITAFIFGIGEHLKQNCLGKKTKINLQVLICPSSIHLMICKFSCHQKLLLPL